MTKTLNELIEKKIDAYHKGEPLHECFRRIAEATVEAVRVEKKDPIKEECSCVGPEYDKDTFEPIPDTMVRKTPYECGCPLDGFNAAIIEFEEKAKKWMRYEFKNCEEDKKERGVVFRVPRPFLGRLWVMLSNPVRYLFTGTWKL